MCGYWCEHWSNKKKKRGRNLVVLSGVVFQKKLPTFQIADLDVLVTNSSSPSLDSFSTFWEYKYTFYKSRRNPVFLLPQLKEADNNHGWDPNATEILGGKNWLKKRDYRPYMLRNASANKRRSTVLLYPARMQQYWVLNSEYGKLYKTRGPRSRSRPPHTQTHTHIKTRK